MEATAEYTIKKAGIEELDIILDLLKDASLWLKTKGLTQWDYYLTDMDGNLVEIIDSIRRGHTYLLFWKNEAAGSLTLEPSPNEWDCDIWGDEASEERCLYLHRLVVKRKWKGEGLGAECLNWAESFCQQNGYEKLRFDCLHSNDGLNHYYQTRYTLRETVHVHGVHNKYEKMIAKPRKSSD
ncbi:GNAT family N-acetyltransferase [Bacillus sp. Marseille-Q1617]|uniref:GNAT family N-acetyltransferase n=1 Tax=Bacillus sp. Marseille-Q1617 TaxID=2736887 RepID=UPI00158925D2|nr:GNAT family N-acetyltransferase [Bacillus sp. Marseille-Q1617]